MENDMWKMQSLDIRHGWNIHVYTEPKHPCTFLKVKTRKWHSEMSFVGNNSCDVWYGMLFAQESLKIFVHNKRIYCQY